MQLARTVFERICGHALEAYPSECCGVVVELSGGKQQVFPIRNIQDEMHERDPLRYPRDARTAYTGHPGDLKTALAAAELGDNRLLAFYHSHPDHAAYFSEEDVAQATPFGEPSYPGALQLVVAVTEGAVGEIKAFCWSPPQQTFVETPLELV